ncbi:MAG: sodium/proline symporter PutP [Oscillospiraceae bacterium]|nr:sodium/proline symporter PutP [Oscillospiraceae bacterium]
MEFNIFTLIAFGLYALIILGIGIWSFNRSKNMSDYFLGGRQLGSWTTAISAQASDMSGWLLMGLPGSVLVGGLTQSWIAIGLFIGTYLNWLIIAARLRKMSYAAGDAITIPEYLQKRFFSNSPVVRFVCAVIIFFFFLIYTASAFSGGAKLFNFVFGVDYTIALTIGALIIISYTFLGGFLAVCWTDLVQGLLMFAALVVVPVVMLFKIPDMGAAYDTALNAGAVTEYYFSFIKAPDGSLAVTTIVSGLAWGLGYFGMPHILVRFMAIKSSDMIKKSRLIATIWVFVTLGAAVLVGVFGMMFLHNPENAELLAKFNAMNDSEKIFMFLSSSLLPALIAGIILSAILAAIMSTADSQLLVTSSAVTNDMFKLFKKNANEKTLMWISRGTVILVAVIAYVIALDQNSSVMGLVSYAWAGLGAAFGPAMLLSLFWKKMTFQGAVAGIITGGASVIIWENVPVLAGTGVYSLLPAFVLAMAAVIVVSLATKIDGAKVDELFAKAAKTDIEEKKA